MIVSVCVCAVQQPHRAISTVAAMKHYTTSVIKEMKRKEKKIMEIAIKVHVNIYTDLTGRV